MNEEDDAPLFRKEKPGRIEWRHPSVHGREKEPLAGKIYVFVYAAALSCLAYILWIVLHESMHYLTCSCSGNGASIASIFPNPGIKCDSARFFSPPEVFFYTMSPYILAVIVLASFRLTKHRFFRLIPYAAFFDLQFNLVLTTLLFMEERKNDATYLLDYLMKWSSGFEAVYILLIAFLILSSALLFRRYYLVDAGNKREGRFYLSAILMYVIIYALNMALLLP